MIRTNRGPASARERAPDAPEPAESETRAPCPRVKSRRAHRYALVPTLRPFGDRRNGTSLASYG